MVVRPNAKAAKTLTPQCDLSPIWNLWSHSTDFALEDCLDIVNGVLVHARANVNRV